MKFLVWGLRIYYLKFYSSLYESILGASVDGEMGAKISGPLTSIGDMPTAMKYAWRDEMNPKRMLILRCKFTSSSMGSKNT